MMMLQIYFVFVLSLLQILIGLAADCPQLPCVNGQCENEPDGTLYCKCIDYYYGATCNDYFSAEIVPCRKPPFEENEHLRLQCRVVSAGDPIVTFSWSFEATNGTIFEDVDCNGETFSMYNITEADHGTYRCTATTNVSSKAIARIIVPTQTIAAKECSPQETANTTPEETTTTQETTMTRDDVSRNITPIMTTTISEAGGNNNVSEKKPQKDVTSSAAFIAGVVAAASAVTGGVGGVIAYMITHQAPTITMEDIDLPTPPIGVGSGSSSSSSSSSSDTESSDLSSAEPTAPPTADTDTVLTMTPIAQSQLPTPEDA